MINYLLKIFIYLYLIIKSNGHNNNNNDNNNLIIEIDNGKIQGIIYNNNVKAYLGIPYAKPPINELRFLPPQPINSWNGIYNASKYGDVCYAVGKGFFVPSFGSVNEDCLSINVFIPKNHDIINDKPLPVLVWLHGGGFLVGSSGNPAVSPDPSWLINEGQYIHVSLNYRLGPLGFLAYPNQPGGGVNGLLDQQLGLKWVQNNIKYFGGDKTNVTLGGESAGAFSICFHLTAPSSKGLFHRVIMMSAVCDWDFQTIEQANEQALELGKTLNCDTLDCLRKIDPWKLQGALPLKRGLLFFEGVRWFPVLSPSFVPEPPSHVIKAHRAHTTDALIGGVQSEGSLFIMIAFPFLVFPGAFEKTIDHTLTNEQANKMKIAIPNSWSERHKLSKVFSDLFSCGILRTAKDLTSLNENEETSEVFLYHFSHVPSRLKWPFRDILGSFHGSELAFLFNISDKIANPKIENELVLQMSHYWARFIHSGNLNQKYLNSHNDDIPHWPEFTIKDQLYWTFNASWEQHLHIRSAHAHEDASKLPPSEYFEGDSQKSPFVLCHFYDQFVTEKGLIMPIQPFPEPFYSKFINVHFTKAIRNHPYYILCIVLFIFAIIAYLLGGLCYNCCSSKGNKYKNE